MKYLLFLCTFLLTACSGARYVPAALSLNSKAPDFSANDQYGNVITLSGQIMKGPVVVLFYRGQWCPVCNRHMSHLQDSLAFITAGGASVIAVTPENSNNIQETARKTRASFSIIYDKNHRIMDAYKVTFRMGKWKSFLYKTFGRININKASDNSDDVLPVPATYIISREGIIIARHFNEDYKQRMSVAEILKALEKNKRTN